MQRAYFDNAPYDEVTDFWFITPSKGLDRDKFVDPFHTASYTCQYGIVLCVKICSVATVGSEPVQLRFISSILSAALTASIRKHQQFVRQVQQL